MKKNGVKIILASLLTASSLTPIYAAEWGQDETGHWYMFDSNSYARNQIVVIDGVTYGFDDQAYMVKGWHNSEGNWYYFSPESGAQVSGWTQIDGNWYYFNPGNSGIMHKSWLKQGTKRYYFDVNGIMKVGAFVVDGYYYFAESDGDLRRNKLETVNGVSVRYDDEGRQWYKNPETSVNGKSGGDYWLPVLEDSDLARQRADVQDNNSEYIADIKDELYENFKQEVSKTKNSTARERKIGKWKDKADRRLNELSVPQDEIDAYIRDVIAAQYGEDNGSWKYTYEETSNGRTITRTYTYWGSYDYDYDYDYDDEYDEYDYDY